MPIYTNKLPQDIAPIIEVTFKELVSNLPDVIPYEINVWASGAITRFGKTAYPIVFIGELETDPDSEMMNYFSSLVPKELGGTISKEYKRQDTVSPVRIYNKGKLIIDRETLQYTEMPTPIEPPTILVLNDLLKVLEPEIKWTCTMHLTGSLVKQGWSYKDTDIIIFDTQPKEVIDEMKKYFKKLTGWRVDIGNSVMVEREPVYLYKLYENGKLCLP